MKVKAKVKAKKKGMKIDSLIDLCSDWFRVADNLSGSFTDQAKSATHKIVFSARPLHSHLKTISEKTTRQR